MLGWSTGMPWSFNSCKILKFLQIPVIPAKSCKSCKNILQILYFFVVAGFIYLFLLIIEKNSKFFDNTIIFFWNFNIIFNFFWVVLNAFNNFLFNDFFLHLLSFIYSLSEKKFFNFLSNITFIMHICNLKVK